VLVGTPFVPTSTPPAGTVPGLPDTGAGGGATARGIAIGFLGMSLAAGGLGIVAVGLRKRPT
jgi:hypothetical protein